MSRLRLLLIPAFKWQLHCSFNKCLQQSSGSFDTSDSQLKLYDLMYLLRRGDVEWVSNTNDACIVSFERHATTDDALVVINSCNRPEKAHLEAVVEGFLDVTPSISGDNPAPSGELASADLYVEAWGVRVYRRAGNGPVGSQ